MRSRPVSRILWAGLAPRPAAISLRVSADPPGLSPSCGLPGTSSGQLSNGPCLALLQVGFAEPDRSPDPLVSSYLTVSPLPAASRRRSVLCGTVRGSPRLGVTQHLALRSPDFPRDSAGDKPPTVPRPPGRLLDFAASI